MQTRPGLLQTTHTNNWFAGILTVTRRLQVTRNQSALWQVRKKFTCPSVRQFELFEILAEVEPSKVATESVEQKLSNWSNC